MAERGNGSSRGVAFALSNPTLTKQPLLPLAEGVAISCLYLYLYLYLYVYLYLCTGDYWFSPLRAESSFAHVLVFATRGSLLSDRLS